MSWNRMLEKRVSCKNIKERTGIKRRTEVGKAQKGHGERGRRNSVWGHTLPSTWEASCACRGVEEHTPLQQSYWWYDNTPSCPNVEGSQKPPKHRHTLIHAWGKLFTSGNIPVANSQIKEEDLLDYFLIIINICSEVRWVIVKFLGCPAKHRAPTLQEENGFFQNL